MNRDIVTYVLPDGRRVEIMWDVCRGVSSLDYTLADGRIVTAVRIAQLSDDHERYHGRYLTWDEPWR